MDSQLDEKEKSIAELKKKVISQEEAISGWTDSAAMQKKLLLQKEQELNILETELDDSNERCQGLSNEISLMNQEVKMQRKNFAALKSDLEFS